MIRLSCHWQVGFEDPGIIGRHGFTLAIPKKLLAMSPTFVTGPATVERDVRELLLSITPHNKLPMVFLGQSADNWAISWLPKTQVYLVFFLSNHIELLNSEIDWDWFTVPHQSHWAVELRHWDSTGFSYRGNQRPHCFSITSLAFSSSTQLVTSWSREAAVEPTAH